MADCPPNPLDCTPAGSNPADPCSPCFEPTAQNFFQVIADLARQVCAMGNQIKAWNQKIDKLRNRINRLEDQLNNLPSPEDATVVNACANADVADEGADAILVCADGTEKTIPASEDECQVLSSKEGLWKAIPRGLSFYPLETVQSLVYGTNTSLNEYDEHAALGCKLWAVLEFASFVTASGSGGGTFGIIANGRTLEQAYIVSGGGDTMSGQGICELTSESLVVSEHTYSSSGSVGFSSAFVKLLGYLA